MLNLIYQKQNAFLITADLDGLLQIRKAGFHICRNIGPYTDKEEYVTLSPQVLRMQWRQLKDLLRGGDWPSFQDRRAAWDARFILVQPGPYEPETHADNLAATCHPEFRSGHCELHLRLSYSRLPDAALRLIDLAKDA